MHPFPLLFYLLKNRLINVLNEQLFSFWGMHSSFHLLVLRRLHLLLLLLLLLLKLLLLLLFEQLSLATILLQKVFCADLDNKEERGKQTNLRWERKLERIHFTFSEGASFLASFL